MTGLSNEAFLHRLSELAPHVGVTDVEALSQRGPGPLLFAVATRLKALDSLAHVWLALAVLGGAFPTEAEVRRAHRAMALEPTATVHRALLASVAFGTRGHRGHVDSVRVVTDEVLLDVNFCAKYRHNTGIQRVVRSTAPHLVAHPNARFVAWTDGDGGYRDLTDSERQLVVAWGSASQRRELAQTAGQDLPTELIVPWKSTVVSMEVPHYEVLEALVALAEFSNNRVAAIGYDAIPLTSARFVDRNETERFLGYLGYLKYADHVAAISNSARTEFEGFVSAVAAQGLHGPRVTTVALPVQAVMHDENAPTHTPDARKLPLVLCVGSIEPRKNQLGVLAAAELAWAQGAKFELVFVGGGSQHRITELSRAIARLRRRNRPAALRQGVNDAALKALYAEASVFVFPTLHEGYGLPVAEALSAGVPVITSNYGPTAEIAQQGTSVLVDPRSDRAIADALVGLLASQPADGTDSPRMPEGATWSGYASALWNAVSKEAQSGR